MINGLLDLIGFDLFVFCILLVNILLLKIGHKSFLSNDYSPMIVFFAFNIALVFSGVILTISYYFSLVSNFIAIIVFLFVLGLFGFLRFKNINFWPLNSKREYKVNLPIKYIFEYFRYLIVMFSIIVNVIALFQLVK